MAINKSRIKAKVEQAISNLPTPIKLYRDIETPDGYDGYTKESSLVKEFNGFLDGSKSRLGVDSIKQDDFGRIEVVRKIMLLAVYDETFAIKVGDYFEIDGIKYKIFYPKNQYDIYWECDCVVIL